MIRVFRHAAVFIIAIAIATVAHGQGEPISQKKAERLQRKWERQTRKANRINRISVLPVLFYTPETSLMFGVAANARFRWVRKDSTMPFSVVRPTAMYSLNQQFIAFANYDLKYARNMLRGNLGYYWFPFFFSGVGNDHPVDYRENYTAEFFNFEADLYRQWFDHFYAGIKYKYRNTTMIDVEEGGLLAGGHIPGAGGSVFSAPGAGLLFDTRDYQGSPTRGWFLEAYATFAYSETGSDFEDTHYLLDVRKYFGIRGGHIIAVQGYGEWHTGNPPFNLMAKLGGQYRMRGYVEGVYRDRLMLEFQAEYRSPVFLKYFAAAAFGATGVVADNFATLDRYWRYTYGLGIRFTPLPQERLFLRFDAGFGEGTYGLYLSIGEAF